MAILVEKTHLNVQRSWQERKQEPTKKENPLIESSNECTRNAHLIKYK